MQNSWGSSSGLKELGQLVVADKKGLASHHLALPTSTCPSTSAPQVQGRGPDGVRRRARAPEHAPGGHVGRSRGAAEQQRRRAPWGALPALGEEGGKRGEEELGRTPPPSSSDSPINLSQPPPFFAHPQINVLNSVLVPQLNHKMKEVADYNRWGWVRLGVWCPAEVDGLGK